MTDAFMADTVIKQKYGFRDGAAWSDSFSSVSIENIIFFVVAACCHVLEVIFDAFKADVAEKINNAVVASLPWYHKLALGFQYGDKLILNEATCQYEYEVENESKQLVKYAAVRDKGTSVQILVSGDEKGKPVPLSNDVLQVFKQYMNKRKIAGVVLNISSVESDKVIIEATIKIDSLVLNEQGVRLSDGTRPIEEAIKTHLRHILYGGTLNKTKIVDAIQAVEGVEDVELGICRYKAGATWTEIKGNNYTGRSGSYVVENLENTLSYVV